jgi:hypothetical protein
MPVEPLSAAVAGVLAAQVMETPAYLQKALHLPLRQDVFAEAGILLGVRRRGRRLVGYLGHATLAALIACAYAAFFQLVGEDLLLVWGAVGGLVHFLVGGAVVGAVFPVVDEQVARPHPGFAYRHYGRRDVATFLVGHLVFGALVGLLYPLLHPSLGLAAAG